MEIREATSFLLGYDTDQFHHSLANHSAGCRALQIPALDCALSFEIAKEQQQYVCVGATSRIYSQTDPARAPRLAAGLATSAGMGTFRQHRLSFAKLVAAAVANFNGKTLPLKLKALSFKTHQTCRTYTT